MLATVQGRPALASGGRRVSVCAAQVSGPASGLGNRCGALAARLGGWENPWGMGRGKRLRTDSRTRFQFCDHVAATGRFAYVQVSSGVCCPPPYSLRPLRREFSSVAIKLPARDREAAAENWEFFRCIQGAAPDSLSARISVIVERAVGIFKHVWPKASCRGSFTMAGSFAAARLPRSRGICVFSRPKRDRANGSVNGVVVYL